MPVWVAQRLWLGAILFAAGAGILYLSRVLALRGPGRTVAALAFMLSPYFLQYAGRISVILLPWAGLPWMVALTVLALRRGGWRYPALFALVVALVSGINASSIIYVGVAPVLWLVYAVAVEREATWRRALGTALTIGLLTLLVLPVVDRRARHRGRLRRQRPQVHRDRPVHQPDARAAEVIRGLGYWYFYGGDRLGPWTSSSSSTPSGSGCWPLSYRRPGPRLLARPCSSAGGTGPTSSCWSWSGSVLSVGAHPFAHPTPVGGVLKAFMTDTTAGLAMRSTDRATPLVVLGLAMLLGSGVSAAVAPAARRSASSRRCWSPAWWSPTTRPSSTATPRWPAASPSPPRCPPTERAAAAHLNATHPGTRVLAIPGDDFAAQRWGDTVDTGDAGPA